MNRTVLEATLALVLALWSGKHLPAEALRLDAIADAEIDQHVNWRGAPKGTAKSVRIQRYQNGAESQLLLKWDVSGVDPAFPLQTATIELVLQEFPDITVDVYGIIAGVWDEQSITWNRWATTSKKLVPLGSYVVFGKPGAVNHLASPSLTPQLTALVKSWITGRQVNHGLLLRAAAPAGGGDSFSAREHGVSPWDPPRLILSDQIPPARPGVPTVLRTYVPQNAGQTVAEALQDPAWKRIEKTAQWRRRRLIFNNDGDDIWAPEPASPAAFLASRTSGLLDSQMDTLFFCTGRTASLWHDTKVGSFLNLGAARRFIVNTGRDCLQIQLDFCRQHGIEAFWSMRMNDVHDSYRHAPALASEKMARRLFSSYKQQHPDYLMGELADAHKHPIQSTRSMWSALDYAIPEVRAHIFRLVEEVCQGYDVDGVELDFERAPIYFTPTLDLQPAAPEQHQSMTALLRRIRQMTQRTAVSRGRPLLVAVRAPLTVRGCAFLGLDLERWLREDLIDLLIVGGGCFPMAMPIRELVQLGHQYDVPVYPCIDNSAMYKGGFWGGGRGPDLLNLSSLEAWRGAAMNIWNAGADGVYLFNCFNPQSAIWRELGARTTLANKDKLYALDYLDRQQALGESKPSLPDTGLLPLSLNGAEAVSVRFPVGEQVQHNNRQELTLWLHFNANISADHLQIRLNGTQIAIRKLREEWHGLPLQAAHIRRGDNHLELTLDPPAGAPIPLLDGVQLLVRYR
ncbi:MAG: DNRLRE domain-containing protein [Planctomycetota bacterium]|nr:DNRLRE domain-containing protein [Planctomycetota bacterium]